MSRFASRWRPAPCRHSHTTEEEAAAARFTAPGKAELRRSLRPDMDAERTGTTHREGDGSDSSGEESSRLHGRGIPKRHARVTVKYNRKELQRRLDVEKWIDDNLDRLFSGQEEDAPEEVNIDQLLDLPGDPERVRKLQELLHGCRSSTEAFIAELLQKLEGVHKQDELQTEGIEHPVICHSRHAHEPYHFHDPQRHGHAGRGHNQTL